MIKCVHLNMCQLYTYMWTPGEVAGVLYELMGTEIVKVSKLPKKKVTPGLSSPVFFFNIQTIK